MKYLVVSFPNVEVDDEKPSFVLEAHNEPTPALEQCRELNKQITDNSKSYSMVRMDETVLDKFLKPTA